MSPQLLGWSLGGLENPPEERQHTMSGSTSSGPETGNGSQPTWGEIDAAAMLHQLDQMMHQDHHTMSMAQAQLREHLGANWEKPDDVGINWNSPTIVNPTVTPPRPGMSTVAKLAMAAGLLTGGIGLGSAIPWVLGKLQTTVPSASSDTDTLYRLELGEPDE